MGIRFDFVIVILEVALATNHKVSFGSNKTLLRKVRGMKWSKQPVKEAIWTVELVPEGLVPGLADHYGNMKKDMQPPPAEASTGDRFHQKVMEVKWRSNRAVWEEARPEQAMALCQGFQALE